MRLLTSSIWIALITACAPRYQAQPGPPPPAPAASAPGWGAPSDMPPAEPEREVGGTPDDPYAGGLDAAEPAAATRTAAHGDTAAWVEAHNRVRARHCAGELTWSAKLAQVAQRWANALRDRGCSFGHSGGSYGENLAAGTTGTLDPATVVKMWYDEIAEYRFPDGGFSMKTGHFTQVVWRGTTQVGCGRSQCKGMDIFVCEYNPAGNWEGQYRDNVKPRGCR